MQQKLILLLLAAWLGGAVLLPAPTAQAAAQVENIQAVVQAEANLPSLVKSRMEDTVRVIAIQLLQGRDLEWVSQENSSQAKIIREVFDKVLVGYTVTDVAIQPGQDTVVTVRLQPWSDTVHTVKVELTVEGMAPEIEAMVRQDLQNVEQVFGEGLQGLPLAAADWTNGVLKHKLNEYMDSHLPEFRADFDFDPDEATTVKLTVYPRLPVVRTIDLSMRSDTVPNVTLLGHRGLIEKKMSLLVGVPVGFVQRHEQEIGAIFSSLLDKQWDFRTFFMHTKVKMQVAPDMELMLRSDSQRYLLRLEGWADIGHKDDKNNFQARLFAGQRLTPRDEILAIMDLQLRDIKWQISPGYRHIIIPGTSVGVRYIFPDKGVAVMAMQELGKFWRLRYEYREPDNISEWALRYRLHDFMAWEYVLDNHNNWFRVIGYF